MPNIAPSPKLYSLLPHWRKNPMAMKHALWPEVQFYKKQVEIIESVRDNRETYVVAGNMLGKDFVAGFIALWFFICHYKPGLDRSWVRVVTTSVAGDHLDVLWGEIGKFATTSKIPLTHREGGPLAITSHEIRFANELEASGTNVRNYMRGFVSAKGEKLQGHHAENTLFLVDESSGVDDEAYNMGMTWAKRGLFIGNPLACNNFFYKGVKAGDLLLSS